MKPIEKISIEHNYAGEQAEARYTELRDTVGSVTSYMLELRRLILAHEMRMYDLINSFHQDKAALDKQFMQE